jgi:glyoxylase I family protein
MAGKNEKIKGCGFHHVSIKVRDLNRSVKFYSEGLGFVEKVSWGEDLQRRVLLDPGDGNYFELGQTPDPIREGGCFPHVAFRTDNCDAAVEAALAAGALVTKEPKDVTLPANPPLKVRIAFIKGPDGEEIEFFQNELT